MRVEVTWEEAEQLVREPGAVSTLHFGNDGAFLLENTARPSDTYCRLMELRNA